MGEISLYYVFFVDWICDVALRKIYILESFSFILGKPQRITRKGFVIYSGTSKEYNNCLAADSESTVNCRKF
jgi:hypothetical protein